MRTLGQWMVGVAVVTLFAAASQAADKAKVTRYVRFQAGEHVAHGVLEGKQIREISGDLFGEWKLSDKTYELSSVELLAPTRPTQVFALAGNYRSHLGDDKPKTEEEKARMEKFKIPQPFFKSPSSIIAHGQNIELPEGSVVHYEAEMVIVIGKQAHDVAEDEALDYVLGVTCGNDVSARDWQKNDVQWWRAKGSDTFGPCGPVVVSGLNYDDLLLQLRLNGEVRQKQRTKDLIHDVAGSVSFISHHVTLQPGDLIFTGTPGETAPIKPGDVVEVELEGVGVLRNKVVAEPTSK